jgi:phosphatidylglycerophosphate synthase
MAARSRLSAIPNAVSLSRLVLAAAFVVFDDAGTRLFLVVLAATTDVLDGWLARRANWTTRLGALIDPVADRVFALVAVSAFLYDGMLSTTGYFVMISRDLMTAVGFLVARSMPSLRPVEFRARFSGKLVTALQFLTFVAILKQPTLVFPLLVCVGAASLYAIVDYTLALSRERVRG